MQTTEPRNPLYLLLLVVAMVFVFTVLAYAMVPVLEQKARDAGTEPPPSPFREALRHDGWKWVLAEVAVLVVVGLASMGLDRYRRWRRERNPSPALGKKASHAGPQTTVTEGLGLIETCRRGFHDFDRPWVLFENGTLVSPEDPNSELTTQAMALLREWGPVHPGTSFGDFNVGRMASGFGWVVTCHRHEIVTVVTFDELPAEAKDVTAGWVGRTKRGQDAEQLRVIHVEDNRATL